MDDLTKYLPHLLATAGGALQWLRAQSKFPEVAYHIFAGAICLAAWFLVQPGTGVDRTGVVQLLIWLPAGLSSVWGGTFAVSGLAKAAVAGGANAGHAAVPVTDSKGGA